MKRNLSIGLLCVVSLVTAACTANQVIALLDAIVAAIEVVIPNIPQFPAADVASVTTYLNAALTITDDSINCGATTVCVATAVADFQRLALPTLAASLPANSLSLIAAVGNAIQAFIKAYAPTPATMAKAPVKLSEKDKGKLFDLQQRIKIAKGKLIQGVPRRPR